MPVIPEGKSSLTVLVDQKVHDRIRKLARRRKVTVNYLCNEALWAMVSEDLISCVLLGGPKNADRMSRVVCRMLGDKEGLGEKDERDLEYMRDLYRVSKGVQ